MLRAHNELWLLRGRQNKLLNCSLINQIFSTNPQVLFLQHVKEGKKTHSQKSPGAQLTRPTEARFNGALSHTNAHVHVNTKCVHNAVCFYAGTQQQGWADIDSVADKWCFSPDLWLMAASVSCLSAGRRELQASLLFLSSRFYFIYF